MKVLVLYMNEAEKKLYQDLFSNINGISLLFFNINSVKKNNIFSYIQFSQKVIIFFDKEKFEKAAHNQLEIYEYLEKFNEKTIIISKDTLPYAVNRKLTLFYCYDIKNKNDFSSLKKHLQNLFTNIENEDKSSGKKVNDSTKTIFNKKIILNIIMIINTIVFISSVSYGTLFEKQIFDNVLIYIIAWILLIISSAIYIHLLIYKISNSIMSSKKNKGNYINKAADFIVSSDFIDKADNKNNTALGRMLLNLDDLQEYYSWSKSQSKTSFYLAIILIIVGILIITVSVIMQIVFNLSITVSLVIALSGAIVEFIAGTSLVVYKNSIAQLNHYHSVLHEDERFLSSVNIVNDLSNEKDKDEMIKELIRSEIELNKIELLKKIDTSNKK